MDTTQPPTPPVYATSSANTGIFGTQIPSIVAFAVGILLFLLPFAEIKCNDSPATTGNGFFGFKMSGISFTNTGLGLATGGSWKLEMKGGGFMSGGKSDMQEKMDKSGKRDPNWYAIAALGLAVIGLLFSISKVRTLSFISVAAGILSAAALIGLMFDLKKQVKNPLSNADTNETGLDNLGFGNMANGGMHIQFTPSFYLAVAVMLLAAFFSYKRMSTKT